MIHAIRRCIIFVLLVGVLFILFSCDLLFQKQSIFEDLEGGIVVHTANPIPANIESDGFTFLVDLNLPSHILSPNDGYRVWIIPKEYLSPDYPGQAYMSPWYYASSVLSPNSRNIKRGGWLGYFDNGNNYRDLRRGSVTSWYIIVEIWDSSLAKNVDYYQSSFDYLVTVN
jgi:hypothetical protein